MNLAIRLSSLLLALLFASAIGYPQPAVGQAEKTAADRKAEDQRKKELERQKELERLKASGVDPKKLDQLRPGVDPTPKPPSAPLKPKGLFATKKMAGKTSLKPEPRPLPKPRITSKKLDDSLNSLSSDHSQHTQSLTDQTPPVKDKEKAETPGSDHERKEPHKPERHIHNTGCQALRTQAEVEACKRAEAAAKKKN